MNPLNSSTAGILAALDSLPGTFTYSQRISIWLAAVLLSALALYSQRQRPPGRSRLPVAVSIIALNYLLPFLFDGDADMLTNITCFIVTSALSSFKAIGWALNRGSLVRPLNLLQFVVVYTCPITPREGLGAVSAERQAGSTAASKKDGPATGAAAAAAGQEQQQQQRSGGGRLAESGGTPLQNILYFFGKAVLLLAVCWVLANYEPPRLLKTMLYNVSLWCGLSMGMDAPAALAGSAMGLDISPHFDRPYASKSLAELWNARWNLTVGNVLRCIIYEPIMELRLVKDPKSPVAKFSPLRRLAAMLSVFFVSGVMHEVLFWYFQRQWLGAWWFYFTLWGCLVAIEAVVRGVLKQRGILIPKWLGWLYTNIVVMLMVDRLWWGPILPLGICEKSVAHALDVLRPVAAALGYALPAAA